jgi:hypothetical protein
MATNTDLGELLLMLNPYLNAQLSETGLKITGSISIVEIRTQHPLRQSRRSSTNWAALCVGLEFRESAAKSAQPRHSPTFMARDRQWRNRGKAAVAG